MAKKAKLGECTFCGSSGPITDDHVPPKALFAKDNRIDLVAVDACAPCNGSWAKDGEYFRNMLAMRDDVGDIPDAQAALEAMMHSLDRPAQVGLRNATLRNIITADQHRSGLFLGKKPAYNVSLVRLSRVVERTVRGLFRHEFGRRVPDQYGVHVIPIDGLPQSDIRTLIGVNRLADAALSGGLHHVGGGVFEYAVARTTDQPDATVWMLRFYGRVYFAAMTLTLETLGTTGLGRRKP